MQQNFKSSIDIKNFTRYMMPQRFTNINSKEPGIDIWNKYVDFRKCNFELPGINKPSSNMPYNKEFLSFMLDEAVYEGLVQLSKIYRLSIEIIFETGWEILLLKYGNTTEVIKDTSLTIDEILEECFVILHCLKNTDYNSENHYPIYDKEKNNYSFMINIISPYINKRTWPVTFEYYFNSNYIDKHYVHALHRHFINILLEIIDNPFKPVKDIQLLSFIKKEQIINKFNQTSVSYWSTSKARMEK